MLRLITTADPAITLRDERTYKVVVCHNLCVSLSHVLILSELRSRVVITNGRIRVIFSESLC